MSNITIKAKGDYKNTYKFLESVTDVFGYSILEKYAKEGVEALRNATPVDSGVTANSWTYEIEKTEKYAKVSWSNTAVTSRGIPIVVLLYYGHGTRQGGYVQPNDFITPAIQPVIDKMQKAMWKEVSGK